MWCTWRRQNRQFCFLDFWHFGALLHVLGTSICLGLYTGMTIFSILPELTNCLGYFGNLESIVWFCRFHIFRTFFLFSSLYIAVNEVYFRCEWIDTLLIYLWLWVVGCMSILSLWISPCFIYNEECVYFLNGYLLALKQSQFVDE